MCVKINEPYIHTDDLFLKVCVASIRPHRVPNHVYYLTPLIQYHGLVWPVDVWSADNIELMEINSLSHYSLIHDLAQNVRASRDLVFFLTFIIKTQAMDYLIRLNRNLEKGKAYSFFSISFFLSLLTINMVCEANNNNNGNTYLVEI